MNTEDIAHLRRLLLSSMSHANARAAQFQAAGKTELATNYGGHAAGLAHALDLLDLEAATAWGRDNQATLDALEAARSSPATPAPAPPPPPLPPTNNLKPTPMTLRDFRDATRHLPADTGIVILGEDGRLCPARKPTHEEYTALETQDPITADLAQSCVLLTTNPD